MGAYYSFQEGFAMQRAFSVGGAGTYTYYMNAAVCSSPSTTSMNCEGTSTAFFTASQLP